MKSFKALSAAFLILIALTVGSKVSTSETMPVPSDARLISSAAALLRHHGLVVSIYKDSLSLVVRARKERCQLMLRHYPVGGLFANIYAARGSAIGPASYLYRGSFHKEAPRARPLVEHYLRYGLYRIRIALPHAPIYAIWASPECDLTNLDWRPIAFATPS